MAADGRHSTQLRNHIIENFTFADAAARAAGTGYTIVAADVGKIAFQTDTSAYYRLTDESPITWVLIGGSGSFAPTSAKYVVAEASADLSAEVNLGALTTGLLKHTVAGAVSTPATAVAGTDYYNPGGTDVAVADGGTGSSTASAARTALGLAIGTDVASFTDARFTTITPNDQTDSYELVLTDAGKAIDMNKGTAVNLTVPANATVAFATGTIIEVSQIGAGQVTLVPAGGVTINSPDAMLKTRAQYSIVSLRKTGTNTWIAGGDLAA